jgi:hypothetical protein
MRFWVVDRLTRFVFPPSFVGFVAGESRGLKSGTSRLIRAIDLCESPVISWLRSMRLVSFGTWAITPRSRFRAILKSFRTAVSLRAALFYRSNSDPDQTAKFRFLAHLHFNLVYHFNQFVSLHLFEGSANPASGFVKILRI